MQNNKLYFVQRWGDVEKCLAQGTTQNLTKYEHFFSKSKDFSAFPNN